MKRILEEERWQLRFSSHFLNIVRDMDKESYKESKESPTRQKGEKRREHMVAFSNDNN